MGAAVKPLDTRHRRKGVSSGRARIARLRERLEVESDPKIRAMIEAQLAAFTRQPSTVVQSAPQQD